jgi:hypothetical protein
MAKLKSGTRIYGTATIDTSVVVGSAVTLSSSGIQVTGISTLNNANATQLQVTGVSTFTNGPVLVGTATSTGTASQLLQVNGGAYVSTRLGVGVTNPATNTQVAIAGTLGISEVGGAGTRTLLFSSGSGFTLNHNDNSNIIIQSQGANKLQYQVTNDSWVIPSTTGTILLVGSGATTGTASQPLQVTGGGYFSQAVGIGTTNPSVAANRLSISNATGGGMVSLNDGGTTNRKELLFTLDTTNNAARIESLQQGIAYRPLLLNVSGGNIGIQTTNPTSTLTVVGNGLFSGTGIVTATTFVGGLTGTASTATTALGFSTTASINTSGIITATGGFVGSLTGTASTATTANNVSDTININTTGIITASTLVSSNDIYSQTYVRIGWGNASGGENHLVFGEEALFNYASAGFLPLNNIAIGKRSLYSHTYGVENIAIGNYALYTNDGGEYNLAIGSNALRSNVYGTDNLAIGWNALYGSTGYNNLALGRSALSGGGNISNNIAIGAYAGNGITGNANIIMGVNIALDSASGSNNVAIGYDVPNLNGSNQLAIGNYSGAWIYGNSSYNVGIGTTNPTTKLHVVGDGRFTGIVTASQLDLSANASTDDSVLYLSGAPLGTSTKNGLLGIGQLSFSDTDIIANFVHNVNGYAQVVVQNKNSGASSSADIIVNNDRSAGTTYYGDFGINGTTFSAGGVFGDPDGTYLYSAGGTLSLGSLNDYAVKIATNNTERVRVNATGVGIGTTNPAYPLQVQGDVRVTGAFRDSTNSPGTSGQFLQSTQTGTQWVSGPTLGLMVASTYNMFMP